ncbi:MAG TPA: hypothetical protein VFB72_19890 [Verrucomicrobiae bacterium]|nr:hypothetical protein [Verrucomicrobiae bacterium]
MASNPEYIEHVRKAVEHLHGCKAAYSRTEPVHETFRGQTVWQGEVEVFDLTGHPKAERAYAWAHKDGPADSQDRFVAVLEIPPVESAVTAVRAAIVAETRRTKAN